MKRFRKRPITINLGRCLYGRQGLLFPEGCVPWRLGQRVWFQAVCDRIEITAIPQGRRGERRHSRRVQRGMKSLLRHRNR